MAFDWSSYLALARELADRGDEASRRTAISRAYYAIFCSVRNCIRDRVPIPENTYGGTHDAVWRTLQESTLSPERHLGEEGQRLKRLRHQADYEDSVPNLPLIVEGALNRAEQMMELVTQLYRAG